MKKPENERLQETIIELFKLFITDSDTYLTTDNKTAGNRSKLASLQITALLKHWRKNLS